MTRSIADGLGCGVACCLAMAAAERLLPRPALAGASDASEPGGGARSCCSEISAGSVARARRKAGSAEAADQ